MTGVFFLLLFFNFSLRGNLDTEVYVHTGKMLCEHDVEIGVMYLQAKECHRLPANLLKEEGSHEIDFPQCAWKEPILQTP